jgi:uncharacterized small protein (DUF1192 family)
MEFWDKFKKGAQEVGEKAAQLGKIAKLQAEIAGINATKGSKLGDLGRKVYALYNDGQLPEEFKTVLQSFISPIEEGEKRIEEKEGEIEQIKAQMREKPEEAPEVPEPVEAPEAGKEVQEKPEEEVIPEKPAEPKKPLEETKEAEKTEKEKPEGS